eukprot:g45418.t1
MTKLDRELYRHATLLAWRSLLLLLRAFPSLRTAFATRAHLQAIEKTKILTDEQLDMLRQAATGLLKLGNGLNLHHGLGEKSSRESSKRSQMVADVSRQAATS